MPIDNTSPQFSERKLLSTVLFSVLQDNAHLRRKAQDSERGRVESSRLSDERAWLDQRQAYAGEQAVRMQRVTAALSEAVTVDDVCDVMLHEGGAVAGTPRGSVTLLADDLTLHTDHKMGYSLSSHAQWEFSIDDDVPITCAIRSGQAEFLPDLDELLARYPHSTKRLDITGTQAVAVLPLASHGRTHGAWALTWAEPRVFEDGELIILLTLAAQGGQAISRARLFERERFIATSLQRTLLPRRLPDLPAASTARRYEPGAAGVEVGGDWYDVISLPGNRASLVIGDVGGHDIDSATVMGQLRNAVRSYAWEGHTAAAVVQRTNQLLCGLEPGVMATCCYVELNLDDGIASIAVAGHPPPLHIGRSGGVSFIEGSIGPALGVDANADYNESTLFLAPLDCLVLYTDGLVESRTTGIEQGMNRLADAARVAGTTRPDRLADSLLIAPTVDGEQEDDVALLVLRWEPVYSPVQPGETRTVRRLLPSSPGSAGVARRFAADVLVDWGAADLVDSVSLLVSELVTNALIHTPTEVELVLQLLADHVRVEVIDQSDRMPTLRPGDDNGGRGLHIVGALARAWGVDLTGNGKSVWFEIARPDPG